jgi:small subunit ribosomal protein S29
LSLYGKYNFSGVHDNDVDPVPNVYDPIRKYHFRDHEKFIDKEEVIKYIYLLIDIING